MATLTTHVLNSVNGTHAENVGVRLSLIDKEGYQNVLFDTQTDSGGRLQKTIDPSIINPSATYELVFNITDYFSEQLAAEGSMRILQEVVFRFIMPDPNGKYHIPVLIAPNSYSIWCSS